MTQYTTTLLLGSDLGDKKKNLELVKDLIIHEVGDVIKCSKIIETEPVGFSSDTMFLNQLIVVITKHSPMQLLNQLKFIEKRMGRVYKKPRNNEKYTSRIIDIDILFYDGIKLNSPRLLIPHPQIYTRQFVKDLLLNTHILDS